MWRAVALLTSVLCSVLAIASIALAQEPPPALGAVLLDDTLTSPGTVQPGVSLNGKNSLALTDAGALIKVTGRGADGASAATQGAFVRGVRFGDGEVRVEAQLLTGRERSRLQFTFRTQAGRPGMYIAQYEPASGIAVLVKQAGGPLSVLAERKTETRIEGGDGRFSIAIRARASSFWLLVNDQPILTASDPDYAEGGLTVGLQRQGDPGDDQEASTLLSRLRVSALADGTASQTFVNPKVEGASLPTAPPCAVSVPLPSNIAITPRVEPTDERVRAFVGAWEGVWRDDRRHVDIPARFIVEDMDQTRAIVIHALGDQPGRASGWSRAEVRVAPEGKIQWEFGNNQATFTLADDLGSIDGVEGAGKVTFKRCSLV